MKIKQMEIMKVEAIDSPGLSRQSGSHALYPNKEGIKVTVPIHGKKDLGKGLLKQIMKDVGLTNEDF